MITEIRADINRRAEAMEETEHHRTVTEVDTIDPEAIKLPRTYKPPKKPKSTVYQH